MISNKSEQYTNYSSGIRTPKSDIDTPSSKDITNLKKREQKEASKRQKKDKKIDQGQDQKMEVGLSIENLEVQTK